MSIHQKLTPLSKKIKKFKSLYPLIRSAYYFIFTNKLIGKILWLMARNPHSSKPFHYEACLCGNGTYLVYLDYGEHKVLSCSKCGLMRNYPKPQSGVYEEEIADTYKNNSELSIQVKDVCVRLKESLSESSNILDFGCGDGRIMLFLKQLGFKNIYGLEVGNYLAKKARERGFAVFGDMNEIPLNLYFDTVISNHVFEHIPDLGRTLNDIKKVMSEGGIMVALTPNIRSKYMRNGYINLLWETHYWQFDPDTFSNVFKNNGFKVVECKTMFDRSNMRLEISSPQLDGNEGSNLCVTSKKTSSIN